MNELLLTIANDLSIPQGSGEKDDSFAYRICYSALANWMLFLTQSKRGSDIGISKNAQTETVETLLRQYRKHFHLDPKFFPSVRKDENAFSHHIRRIYEETGYLLNDEQNNSIIATFSRTIETEDGCLYFGIPGTKSNMNGLGLYCDKSGNNSDLFEAMLRDTLPVREYLQYKYNPLDFDDRDINPAELSFFNPTLRKSPSSSWGEKQSTIASLARDSSRNMYRTLITSEGKLLFAGENSGDDGTLISSEHRRIYCALKSVHEAPVIAWISTIDDIYSTVHISAQLPNREYYFMLLLSWPERSAYDKNWFICKHTLLPTIEKMLKNIGIQIRR